MFDRRELGVAREPAAFVKRDHPAVFGKRATPHALEPERFERAVVDEQRRLDRGVRIGLQHPASPLCRTIPRIAIVEAEKPLPTPIGYRFHNEIEIAAALEIFGEPVELLGYRIRTLIEEASPAPAEVDNEVRVLVVYRPQSKCVS